MGDIVRKAQTGEPTGNGGHFGSVRRPEADTELTPASTLEPPIDWRKLEAMDGGFLPGNHPHYGPGQWGVSFSEHWGDFQVNHGYYGTFSGMDSARRYDSTGALHEVLSSDVMWTSDQGTGDNAATVWQHRDDITRALHTNGYGGRKKIRARVTVEEDQLIVRDYDYPDSFEPVTLPRRR